MHHKREGRLKLGGHQRVPGARWRQHENRNYRIDTPDFAFEAYSIQCPSWNRLRDGSPTHLIQASVPELWTSTIQFEGSSGDMSILKRPVFWTSAAEPVSRRPRLRFAILKQQYSALIFRGPTKNNYRRYAVSRSDLLLQKTYHFSGTKLECWQLRFAT